MKRRTLAKLGCAVPCCVNHICRHRNETPISGPLRPPALVTEYLASGSLRAAIARQAEFILKSNTVKCKLALDAARVSLAALGGSLCSLLGNSLGRLLAAKLHGYAQLMSAGGYLLAQDANALCLTSCALCVALCTCAGLFYPLMKPRAWNTSTPKTLCILTSRQQTCWWACG